MTTRKSICPDCDSPMQAIQLLDATHRTPFNADGSQHVNLRYAAVDATASFWSGAIPALGIAKGMICPDCGRIALYGEAESE